MSALRSEDEDRAELRVSSEGITEAPREDGDYDGDAGDEVDDVDDYKPDSDEEDDKSDEEEDPTRS